MTKLEKLEEALEDIVTINEVLDHIDSIMILSKNKNDITYPLQYEEGLVRLVKEFFESKKRYLDRVIGEAEMILEADKSFKI